jgi:hypothetical protein
MPVHGASSSEQIVGLHADAISELIELCEYRQASILDLGDFSYIDLWH